MPVVLLTDPIDQGEAAKLQEVAEVRMLGEPGVGALEEEISRVNAVIVRRPIPHELLHEATALRALVRHGVGLDFIPVDAASAAGIAVTNTPDTNAQSVAEHVFGLILALQRRIAHNDRLIRAGEWHTLRTEAPLLHEIAGMTLGIIGFGGIGEAVARIGRFGFGMNVIAARQTPRTGPDWVKFSSIEEVTSSANVLVIACPLSPRTQGLVDSHLISLMDKDAIIVNAARGAIIDEDALATALLEQRIAGAALDVFSQQPLPESSPLRTCSNLLLSPHVAGVTCESMRRMSEMAVNDTLHALQGNRPKHLVNTSAWPQISERWLRHPI